MLTIKLTVKRHRTKLEGHISAVDQVKSGYHGGVAQSGLGELLRLGQLGLEAGSEDAGVGLFQNTMEGFPKHKVRVLNAQHVLRGGMKQAVPISWRHKK